MKKIYLAGPDVFRPDAQAWAAETRKLCRHHGFEALTPLDHDERMASRIFAANLTLIDQADCVLANLAPFRGCEPDSGTCFEIGYAHARGKKIAAYLDRKETLRERVNRFGFADSGRSIDNLGMMIEDFGLPLNLMLAIPACLVESDLQACLQKLQAEWQSVGLPDAEPVLPKHPRAAKAIEAALRYLQWTESGKISDPDALETVARHYRVKAETVQAWAHGARQLSPATDVEYLPEDVVRQMKIGGRQYQAVR